MQIISGRARVVCVVIATVASTLILGSTVLGLTSAPSAPVASAQAPAGNLESVAHVA
jgi:hypothetical protein